MASTNNPDEIQALHDRADRHEYTAIEASDIPALIDALKEMANEPDGDNLVVMRTNQNTMVLFVIAGSQTHLSLLGGNASMN